jgi:hypothetical protein
MAIVLGACAAASEPPPPSTAAALQPLTRVTKVDLRWANGALTADVQGLAPSAGYRQVQLRAVNYIQAPPDGIYDYTLVGLAPSGLPAQVLTPVAVAQKIADWPSSIRGVRVHASDGAIVAMTPRP